MTVTVLVSCNCFSRYKRHNVIYHAAKTKHLGLWLFFVHLTKKFGGADTPYKSQYSWLSTTCFTDELYGFSKYYHFLHQSPLHSFTLNSKLTFSINPLYHRCIAINTPDCVSRLMELYSRYYQILVENSVSIEGDAVGISSPRGLSLTDSLICFCFPVLIGFCFEFFCIRYFLFLGYVR